MLAISCQRAKIVLYDAPEPEIKSDDSTVQSLIQPVYVRTTKSELNLPPVNRKMIRLAMNPEQSSLYNLLKFQSPSGG